MKSHSPIYLLAVLTSALHSLNEGEHECDPEHLCLLCDLNRFTGPAGEGLIDAVHKCLNANCCEALARAVAEGELTRAKDGPPDVVERVVLEAGETMANPVPDGPPTFEGPAVVTITERGDLIRVAYEAAAESDPTDLH